MPSPSPCHLLQPTIWKPAKISGSSGGAPRISGNPVVDALLYLRGIDAAAADDFLKPKLANLTDPFTLPNMAEAVARVTAAINNNKLIALYGDYDVDGVTSLTILKRGIEALGGCVHCFLPHRMDEGYGLSADGISRLLDECQPDLVMAVDCGTSSVAEGKILAEKTIDLVVLDHHQPGSEGAADAIAIVNPQLGENQHYLCSAGLAFKFLHAMLKSAPEFRDKFDIRSILDLTATGTVADLVPLEGDNRILVKAGLKQLTSTKNHGLKALLAVAGVKSSPVSSDIGFRIGPRLNAAGRLDTAMDALNLLTADDSTTAQSIASLLDTRNRDRQSLEKDVLDQALEQLRTSHPSTLPAAIVLADERWHPGVVGIVASRIMRTYHRPTFIIGFDESGIGKGSGRSISGIDLVAHIQKAMKHLIKGGGHAAAAGISIEKSNVDAFRDALCASISTADDALFHPYITPDIELTGDQLSLNLLDDLEHVAPYGMGNPEPLFCLREASCIGEPKALKDKHWKFRIADQSGGPAVDCIWFSGVEKLPELPSGEWDLVFNVQRNEWRGQQSIQLLIRALKASGEE